MERKEVAFLKLYVFLLVQKLALQRFFIFNSSWGPTEETENEKIVFFYPEDDKNLHSKHIGLIEALITFMTVFSEQHPAHVQHNMKTKTVFREFEPGMDYFIHGHESFLSSF